MDTLVCPPPSSFRGFDYNPDCCSEGFIVEDLLDFSNDDIGAPIDEENASEETSASASIDGNYSPENENNQTASQDLPEELCVPMDSLEDLEWLSNFVEDSFSVGGLGELPSCYLLPSTDGKKDHYKSNDDDESNAKQEAQQKQKLKQNSDNNNNVVFSACKDLGTQWIPVRARRSKRCRAGGRVWTFFPLLPSHPGFESQASIFSTSDSSSNSCLTYSRPPKKQKQNHNHNNAKRSQDANAAPARRCSHCLVQKTPQWRAGPLGPKTLCNACGVRFKSGRLLPEYRPAVSPTFLSDVHSNSHRKVLELRRQKEQEDQKQDFTSVEQEQEEQKQNLTPVQQEQEEQNQMFASFKQGQGEKKHMFTSVKQEQEEYSQFFTSVKQEQEEQKQTFTSVKQEQEEQKQNFIFVKQEQDAQTQGIILA